MYWTTYKKGDSPIKHEESFVVAVDSLIYLIGSDFRGNGPIDIHILNTYTLIWSLLPVRTDINGKTLKPPDVPVKRKGHTVVAYNKKIYLWGGRNEEKDCTTLYCFDTKTLNWSRPKVTGVIPGNRYFHSACISSHLMYIFDGDDLNDHHYGLHDVHCLDLKTMNWSYIKTFGEVPGIEYYGATIVNNRIYTFGGSEREDEHEGEDTHFLDTMYLDLKLDRWHRQKTTGLAPAGALDRSLFVHNNKIYAFGNLGAEDNEVYYFDTKRNHWSLIKPRGKSPEPNGEDSCIVIRDKMFFLCALGCRDPDALFGHGNSVYVLDLNPSLKTLAIMAVMENGLDASDLPEELRSEIHSMGQH